MASPAKVAPPATLPADFFDKQGGAPATLPGDFFDKQNAAPKNVPEPSMAQNFQNAFDELATAPQFDIHHPFKTGAQDLGAGVMGMMGPIFHPLATLDAAGKLLTGSTADKMSVLRPMAQTFKQNPVGQGIAALPALATAPLGGEGESVARGLGEAAERGGLNLGNAALGARGPSFFRYGANPARGAFEEGVLPAWGKHSAAMNLERVLPQSGQRISEAVMHGGTTPLEDIARSINSPVNEARAIIEGPGGGSRSVAPVEALQSSMEKRAPGASAPIYGPNAGTRFTADEAIQAMMDRGPRLLPAPMEDVPLHSAPDVEGRLSQPVRLTQVDRPGRPLLQAPSLSTPMAPGMQAEFPERLASGDSGIRPTGFGTHPGMGAAQYIGEIPGERGGLGLPQGVLRRAPVYPESTEQTPLVNLRHPHATAPDIWKTIRNLDKNTRFNPDPEVEGVNELRRDIRGGLRSNLEQATPGLKPLTQRYGDLKGAEEALDKSMFGGTTLSRMAKVPMFPIESTIGKAMYRGGRALQGAAPLARVGMQSAPVASFLNTLRKKEK